MTTLFSRYIRKNTDSLKNNRVPMALNNYVIYFERLYHRKEQALYNFSQTFQSLLFKFTKVENRQKIFAPMTLYLQKISLKLFFPFTFFWLALENESLELMRKNFRTNTS